MKFKRLYFLSYAFILSALPAAVSCITPDKKDAKTPTNIGKIIPRPQITYMVDTITVNDSNFNQIYSKTPAGLFFPQTNKVVVKYFKPDSKNQRIKNFCDNNNKMIPLVRRHEFEHARKANLTKQTDFYNPYIRGKIAASNEIIAPAAEIIEALDWRHTHGRAFPATKNFICDADREIVAIMDSLHLPWPVDFNTPAIADIVIKYALKRFTDEFGRGQYVTTVQHAIKNSKQPKYTPNAQCNITSTALFAPLLDDWGALWEFESARGSVNIWKAATSDYRTKLQLTLDSCVVCAAQNVGINALFLKSIKTY